MTTVSYNNPQPNMYNIINEMYSIRSSIRSIYMNANSSDIYNLEEYISRFIKSTFNNKNISININIKEFYCTIEFAEEYDITISERLLMMVSIESLLKEFISKHTSNKEIIDYITSDKKPILDFFTVGKSFKLIF